MAPSVLRSSLRSISGKKLLPTRYGKRICEQCAFRAAPPPSPQESSQLDSSPGLGSSSAALPATDAATVGSSKNSRSVNVDKPGHLTKQSRKNLQPSNRYWSGEHSPSVCPARGSPWKCTVTGKATARILAAADWAVLLKVFTYRAAREADIVPRSATSRAAASGGTTLGSSGMEAPMAKIQTR
jgi:hypothetical protein